MLIALYFSFHCGHLPFSICLDSVDYILQCDKQLKKLQCNMYMA